VGGVSGTRPGTDGAFQISGVREGEYSVRALGLPQGYYLKSVRYAGKDVSNQTFRFSGSGSDALELILRQGTSQISGVVVDAKSQPVPGAQAILIPEESLRARTELYKTVTTDNSGHFVMPNVPPGNYKIFSWEAIEANGYYNPDVMKQSEAQGTAIKLEESLNRTTEVKWIPAVEN